MQPIRLCTLEMLELWWQALPEAFAWDQLKLMRSWGLDVAWRKEAWRVWWRFQQGKQPLPEHPRCGFHFVQVAQERDCPITKVEEWSHDGREYIWRQGRPLPNQSQLRNVSNSSALPVGSGGPPSDVELAWQAQDFQGNPPNN